MSVSDPFPPHEAVQVLARQAGLELTAENTPGIIENMLILQHYSDLINAFPLSDHCPPAFGYQP